MCVISALLTDGDSGTRLAELLEQYRLANRDCGKNLLMGILADLREADIEEMPGDEAIISAAARAVDKLNEKYGGGFYLFTRPRTLDSGRGRFGACRAYMRQEKRAENCLRRYGAFALCAIYTHSRRRYRPLAGLCVRADRRDAASYEYADARP